MRLLKNQSMFSTQPKKITLEQLSSFLKYSCLLYPTLQVELKKMSKLRAYKSAAIAKLPYLIKNYILKYNITNKLVSHL